MVLPNIRNCINVEKNSIKKINSYSPKYYKIYTKRIFIWKHTNDQTPIFVDSVKFIFRHHQTPLTYIKKNLR